MIIGKYLISIFVCLCHFLIARGNSQENIFSDLKAPAPTELTSQSQEKFNSSLNQGISFLIKNQNEDGSWGDLSNTLAINLICTPPGGPDAFQTAVTSLCALSLTNSLPTEEIDSTLNRAEAWLLKKLPTIRRTSEDTVLNFWSHSYRIRALCSLALRHSPESEIYKKLKNECQHQVNLLEQNAYAAGGWGYYEFGKINATPQGESTSFCTATGLLALDYAQKKIGIHYNDKIIKKAIHFLKKQRTPDGTYVYSLEHMKSPLDDINRISGSLARIQSCNLALHVYQDPKINLDVIENGLNWLWSQKGWLNNTRKKPVPHEGFSQNAGYFFYYDYFYAAEEIALMPKNKQTKHFSFLINHLVPIQEKDGSWWDFPMYNYHKFYGTAYAVYALNLAKKSLNN